MIETLEYTTSFLPQDQKGYRVSEETRTKLNNHVYKLKGQKQSRFEGQIDLAESVKNFNRNAVVATLPEGISENDFVRIQLLSYLTEVPTLSYAGIFVESAKRYDAPWLKAFTEDIWTPDELQHGDPFKAVLLGMGYSNEELERQAKETKQKVYEHYSGVTPVHLTMFGLLQEYLTDHWYRLTRPMLKNSSPQNAEEINQVRIRETLHRLWYQQLTAIQIEDNPRQFVPYIGSSLADFKLPGNYLTEELLQLQGSARAWIPKLGGEARDIEKFIVRHTFDALNENTDQLGQAILQYGTEKPNSLLTKSIINSIWLASHLPGLGPVINRVSGQAIQERNGIKVEDDNKVITLARKKTVKLLERFDLAS